MKRERFVVATLLGIVAFLWFVWSWMVNSLNDQSVPLTKVQQQVSTLHKQNMLLHDELLHETSYTLIASVAASMGFVKAETYWLGQ